MEGRRKKEDKVAKEGKGREEERMKKEDSIGEGNGEGGIKKKGRER